MPATVLVVEDNALLRDVMALALESAGYSATLTSGAEAAALACSARPDLILLDLGMPDLGGAEVYRRLRSDERTAYIPIIAMTGRPIPDDMRVDDLLAKPFTMQLLLHKVRKWTGTVGSRHAATRDTASLSRAAC